MSQIAVSPIAGGGGFGQAHTTVVSSEVERELASRGYSVKPVVVTPPVVHVARTLTRSMAISVACDQGIAAYRLPKTTGHPYRCPRLPQQCYLTQSSWNNLVSYIVRYANRYLAGTYSIPSWARTALRAGTLRGTMGFRGLGAVDVDEALPGWVKPAIVGGCLLLVLLLMKK